MVDAGKYFTINRTRQYEKTTILAALADYLQEDYEVVSIDFGDQDQRFYEEDGRQYFILYLKPIINGTGNYYVEAQLGNQGRTDLIID